MQSQIDHFLPLRTIATGANSKLKLAEDTQTGQVVVLKLLSLSARKHFLSEVSALKLLPAYSGIVTLRSSSAASDYLSKSGKRSVKAYVELDFCPHGDLFSRVAQGGAVPQRVARWCFGQVLGALTHLHAYGIAHLDVKPENILIDSSFRLRLCDFGFSTITENGLVRSMKGTRAYKAPETYSQASFAGEKADIFSLAVTTFVLVTGKPPFIKADVMDSFYHFAAVGDWERFWGMYKDYSLSSEFKDLMEHTLCFDPRSRLSLLSLKHHPWVLSDTAMDAEAEAWLRSSL